MRNINESHYCSENLNEIEKIEIFIGRRKTEREEIIFMHNKYSFEHIS